MTAIWLSLTYCLVSNALQALVVIQLDRAGRHFSVLRPAKSDMYSCGCPGAGISPASGATRGNESIRQVGSTLDLVSKSAPVLSTSTTYTSCILLHSFLHCLIMVHLLHMQCMVRERQSL